MKLPGRLRQQAAWLPWDWSKDPGGASAIQALAEGRADADQQQRAIKAIVEGVCATYELSYSPDSTHDTAFAEGMRHVGMQIVKATKLNMSVINKARPTNG